MSLKTVIVVAGLAIVMMLAGQVGVAQAETIVYYEFETESGVGVTDGQAAVTYATAPSGNKYNIDNTSPDNPYLTVDPLPSPTPDPLYNVGGTLRYDGPTYEQYGLEGGPPVVPASIDPAGLTGSFCLYNTYANQRLDMTYESSWGNAENDLTMEGFLNLQEDLSTLTPGLVDRRIIVQKRNSTNYRHERVTLGLGYSEELESAVLGIRWVDTDEVAYDVLSTVAAGKVVQNEWHHFAVTVKEQEDETDDIRFYLDYVEVGNVLDLTNLAPADTAQKTFLTYDVASSRAFKGYLDAIRVVAIPEPSSIVALLVGFVVLLAGRVWRP